jgi:hypothetical protein
MTSKKRNKRRTRSHRDTTSVELKRTDLTQQASDSPFLTTQYLRAIWQTHPLRPKSITIYFGVFSCIAFFLALAAANGLLPQLIIKITNENMSPWTAIIVGAVCLWALSGVIAFHGPFTARSSLFYQIFGVALPTTAITLWGSICGISIGTLAAALVMGAPVAQYLNEVKFRLGLFAFGLMVFLSVTVTTADAPHYASRQFRFVIRCLASAMFLILIGWFIVGGLHVSKQ